MGSMGRLAKGEPKETWEKLRGGPAGAVREPGGRCRGALVAPSCGEGGQIEALALVPCGRGRRRVRDRDREDVRGPEGCPIAVRGPEGDGALEGCEVREPVRVPGLLEEARGVECEDNDDCQDGEGGDDDKQFDQGETLNPLVISRSRGDEDTRGAPVQTGIDQGETETGGHDPIISYVRSSTPHKLRLST